ncbi:protein YpfM [Pantoea ananatis]|nr:protein YpfM [Pantoea ananatis]QZE30369.1 protein YpfM [Pantoea ananatis]
MRQPANQKILSILSPLPIVMTGVNVFTRRKKRRNIATTIREGSMIDTEMGNWKEFIEAMLRNK